MPESNPVDEFDSLSGGPVPGIDPEPAARDGDGELERARKLVDEQRALYVRTLADFDNYKKRVDREMRSRSDLGRREVLKRLLSVLDSLQRAAAFRDNGAPPEQLVDGLLATVKQFETVLEAENVRPIETVGKPFDPSIAEAVATVADASVPDGTVLNEARRGYAIDDDVLRPAQVVVAKHD
jgi:molecular chaperone GrpE